MKNFFGFHDGNYHTNLNWWKNEACLSLPKKETFGIRTRGSNGLPLPNVIGMVTAENQKRADERIPDLLACPYVLDKLAGSA